VSRILVLEQQPRWYPELRRQLADSSVRIQSRSKTAEVRGELAAQRHDGLRLVLLVDLNVGAAGVLALAAAARQRSDVRLIVVGQSESRPLESVLRELGTDSFFLMPVSGEQIATECARLAGLEAAPVVFIADPAGS
jgi:DNA-binding response OmpR family regulator